MASADVTRRALTLGAADTETGWYAKTFTETTIQMIIRPRGSSFTAAGVGYNARYNITGFTADGVLVGDEIVDSNSVYYSIDTVEEEWWLDSFSHYIVSMNRMPLHADRPTTYGTAADVLDPRERMKTFLDDGLIAANLLEDNGATQATFLVCFAFPDYPINKIFLTKTVDLLFCCGGPTSNPLGGFNHKPYGYEESVPITVYAVDKAVLTAENLLNQARGELRRLQETSPAALNLRTVRGERPVSERFGGQVLYSQEFVWTYRRDIT